MESLPPETRAMNFIVVVLFRWPSWSSCCDCDVDVLKNLAVAVGSCTCTVRYVGCAMCVEVCGSETVFGGNFGRNGGSLDLVKLKNWREP